LLASGFAVPVIGGVEAGLVLVSFDEAAPSARMIETAFSSCAASYQLQLLRLAWSDDADKLIVENRASGQSLMDAAGQSRYIRIVGANDDARVGLLVLVQPDEIGTIKGQHRALLGDSKDQHVTVSDSLIGPTRLVGRQHVMTQ